MGSVLKVCGGWVVGKPNLVKDFCPRLPLDLCFDFGLGQAFQKIYEAGNSGSIQSEGFKAMHGEREKKE